MALLGVHISSTFTQTVMLFIALMAEKLQIVDKIRSLIGLESRQIVLFSFPWLSFEVVVQYYPFVVADYDVGVCD